MTLVQCCLINNFKVFNIYRAIVRNIQNAHCGIVLKCCSFGLALAKCESPEYSGNEKTVNLTREECIKQACLLSVNSASTLLTTTTSAILDLCNNYKDSLNKILSLLEEVQTFSGESPDLWDAIVEARLEVNKAKASLNKTYSYMESVVKVVTATTEAAFLAGAEYTCTALCERLDSAQREIKIHIDKLKKLEEDYLLLQKEIVSNKENNKAKMKNKEADDSKNNGNSV